jgi:hypothetical protein
LRSTLFLTLLGAVLALVYTFVRTQPSELGPLAWVVVLILAGLTVLGVLLLERAAAGAMILMLVATGLGLGNGTAWLIPGVVLAAIWAANHNRRARTILGFLLLLPGIAGGYYGLLGTLGFISHVPLDGLLPNLGQPLRLAQALAPLELLPLALLGAWLLISAHPARS